MKTSTYYLIGVLAASLLCQCTAKNDSVGAEEIHENSQTGSKDFHGYESQIKWGEHLVIIGGCNDCHTPKKMGPHGPELDSALMLSGHPATMPSFEVNRREMESKGLIVTQDLTEWVGPWGVSFAANLTPDPSGLGNWSENQFMYAIRNGKYKGLPESRPLLPPMPWEMYRYMNDEELKAIFAYLQSIQPVNNVVPAPKPPVGAQ